MAMTAVAPVRAPTPRLKATAIAGTTSESATAFNPKAELPSRPQDPATPAPRRPGRPVSLDFLTDKATTAFIRRVLCSQHLAEKGRGTPAPIEDLLPPLTSRNDVDLQLYALIAVILREFVQAWYGKITPDEAFVGEIVQTIAHCTRALEQRLRKVDLESLALDELPDLLDRHVTAYRTAHDPMVRPPTEVDPREIYHSLCPLAPLSPVPKPEDGESVLRQKENEGAYRQLLVQGVLAILLPTEDLENDCLTSLVGQIFSELIIGNIIANRLSQPWLIWEGLCILVRVIGKKAPDTIEQGVEEALQTGTVGVLPKPDRRGWTLQRMFWSMLHWSFLVFTSVRLLITTLAMSRSLPPRRRLSAGEKGDLTGHKSGLDATNPVTAFTTNEADTVPIVTFKLWSCMSNLIEMDARMPWLSGTMSMLQLAAVRGPGKIAGLDGVIDRLLSYTIQHRMLDASHLPPLLRTIRGALFPNNSLGAPTMVAPSSDEELLALRRRCASAIWGLLPRWLSGLYFGGRGLGRWRSGPKAFRASSSSENQQTDQGQGVDKSPGSEQPDVICVGGGGANSDTALEDSRIISEIDQGILDVFSDEYCNKHLMYSALELILVRLMPELAEKGVIELWEERL